LVTGLVPPVNSSRQGERYGYLLWIDWAEAHHDATLVDEHGTELARMRIGDDAADYHALVNLLVARN
jgi:hypothetical protein